jgi:hypothetical protein
LAELYGTGGQVAKGFRGGRAGLGYGPFVYHGQLSLLLGGSDGFPGHHENTRRGMGWGTNIDTLCIHLCLYFDKISIKSRLHL